MRPRTRECPRRSAPHHARGNPPLAARFLTADPILQAPFWSQGMNRYAYVFNDPINTTDPTGFLGTSEAFGVGVGGTAAGILGYGIATSGGWSLPALGGAGAGAAGAAGAFVGGAGVGASIGGGVLDLFFSKPGSEGTVANTANVAPTTQPSTQGGGRDAIAQNKGFVDGVPPKLCDSYVCLAQNAGDPSTGAHGQGNLSSAVPTQPSSKQMADWATWTPMGRGAAGAKAAAEAGWITKAWNAASKWVRGLFDGARGIRVAETWGNPKTLVRHFRDHGADFAAKNADDYAAQASSFFQRSQAQRLPTKIDADGVIRVYDPTTNTFGAFNPNGTTRTFFKPSRGASYWNDQPGVAPWSP
jgi:hypothetical protein